MDLQKLAKNSLVEWAQNILITTAEQFPRIPTKPTATQFWNSLHLRFKSLIVAFSLGINKVPPSVWQFLHKLTRGYLSIPQEFMLEIESERLDHIIKRDPMRRMLLTEEEDTDL